VCGGPVATARAKHGIAHERLGEQADQFLAIDGIHSTDDTARTEEEQWRRSRTFPAGYGGPLMAARARAVFRPVDACWSGDREMRAWGRSGGL
jgi:hypothetical protein